MGTRCLVHIKEEGLLSKTLVTLYRQYDGYLSGMGLDIARALNNGVCTVVNGYQVGQNSPEVFNGMGCLAAYLVGALKKGIGNVYIYPIDSSACGEEYIYTIYIANGRLMIQVADSYGNNSTSIYLSDFKTYLNSEEDEE